MSGNKDLQFCMDQLRFMLNRDGLEPEQKSALENAQEELKRLRRKPNPTRPEVYRAVRRVAEAMVVVFLRK